MYRLLIVDDEPNIVNGLVQLFQENEQFDLDVYKAFSAKEAIEMAKKMKLDIVVSDIRMPQKDGLQLVDELLFYWPHCRIIFLTGYSDFGYIQDALRKNADNYILKTEGVDPIFEAVKTAMRKLDEENRSRNQWEKAQLLLQIAEPFLKQERMIRLLSGESVHALRSEPGYADLDFCIEADRTAFLLIGTIDTLENTALSGLIKAAQRLFDNCLPSSIAREQAILNEDKLVCFLQPDEELLTRLQGEDQTQANPIKSYMRGIWEQVQNECEMQLGVSVSFGISGNLAGAWDKLRHVYESLLSMMQNRAKAGQKMVMIDLESSSEEEEALYEPDPIQEEEMRSIVIDRIHAHIHDHLSGDLSLTALAEKAHFNPSYLSRYYKQMTGRNLLDYIQSKRLDEARRLMDQTNLKLNEIAVRVGFESHSYFTTFFKKKMGVSPQEYRNH